MYRSRSRAILFDKRADQNWCLGWHQDHTIAVKQRVEVDGFGPWSVKSGMVHVEPPFGLLASVVTLRVQVDPVPVTNAPLLVASGSHKHGSNSHARNSRCRPSMRRHSMSSRGWGHLAICAAYSSPPSSRYTVEY